MAAVVAQELGIYDESMLSSRLFYLASYVETVWDSKKQAIESGQVYIGG